MKKRTLAMLMPLAVAVWDVRPALAQAYKCIENGQTVYQDGPCASGASKAVDTRSAKGFEAPKGRPSQEAGAPVSSAPAATPAASPAPTTRARCTSSYSKCN